MRQVGSTRISLRARSLTSYLEKHVNNLLWYVADNLNINFNRIGLWVLYHNKTKKPLIVRSDGGLTLEASAFQIFHRGYLTFINSFDKTKFHVSVYQRSTTFPLESRNL